MNYLKRLPLIFIVSMMLLTITSFAQPATANTNIIEAQQEAEDGELRTWEVKKVFPEMELVPGLGMRTVATFVWDDLEIKAYCLDPGLPIPPPGTKCTLDATNTFQCGIFQRFKPMPEEPTPTPTPTPEPFSCEKLGLGLHVKFAFPGTAKASFKADALALPTREFKLEPLAIAPDEIWNNNPIRMFTPGKTCGTFTVFGQQADLPPQVKKVEVVIDCPGIQRDLSAQSADGSYCFGCNDILYTQKLCTVTNRLYVEENEEIYVCQAFYKVTDPPLP